MKSHITVYRLSILITIFGLLATLIPMQTASAASNTLTIQAEADTHVNKSLPRQNFGASTALTLDKSPVLRSYLRFNVTGLNGMAVKQAKLRLYALKASSSGLTVLRVSNNTWSESGVTFSSAPVVGKAVRSKGAFKANQWIELDVTPAVKGEGKVSFAVNNRGTAAFNLASHELQSGAYAPQLALTLAAPGPKPYGVAGNWTLKFSDEFDGSSLDLTKWQPNWLAANNTAITKPINSAELSCYDPSLAKVANGSLKLSLVARSCKANNGKTYRYASGLVNSRSHFTFTYGYMEARVWLDGSSTPANWPAFWADGTGSWPATGEIDVMEGLTGSLAWHYHYGSSSSPKQVGGYPKMSSKTGWHIFGADWERGVIKFYYDGVYAGQVTSNVVASKMFLILNYGLSSKAGATAKVPSSYLVDYVRVWKKQ